MKETEVAKVYEHLLDKHTLNPGRQLRRPALEDFPCDMDGRQSRKTDWFCNEV